MSMCRYQLEGVNWMISSWAAKRNCMLADEMGLGKTAQIVATIAELSRTHGVSGPYLIIAPLSTIGHWSRELASWSDMRTLTLHGSAADRAVLLKYLWHGAEPNDDADGNAHAAPRGKGKGSGFWFEVVVTT